MSSDSGIDLLNHAQLAFHTWDTRTALDAYRKCIKKLLNDENVNALALAAGLPDNYPHELLGFAWSGFLDCFKDANLNRTEAMASRSYNLLKSFQPGSNSLQFQEWSSRFSTERGRVLLKGLQITAGFVLGLLAWDKQGRAKTARRYQEALELARTYTPFVSYPNTRVGLERYVSEDVKQMEEYIKVLEFNDTLHASIWATQGQCTGRRDVIEVPTHVRVQMNGEQNHVNSFMLATNACAKCGIHKMCLQKCGRCKSTLCKLSILGCIMMTYLCVDCGAECQRSHWTLHKPTCRRPAQSG